MQGHAAVDNKNSEMEVKHTRVGSTAVVRREPAAWERGEATSSSTRDMHCVGVCVCVCVCATHAHHPVNVQQGITPQRGGQGCRDRSVATVTMGLCERTLRLGDALRLT